MTITQAIDSRRAASDPAWPVLHPFALQGLVGEVVGILAPCTEADPAGLLGDLLASFGNAAGATPHALAGGVEHPARLNVVLVGETARARKGTARAIVRRMMAYAEPAWSATQVRGGLSSGEGLITALADATVDAEGNPVGGQRDKRLLIAEPELARVLGVASREGNILSSIIRQSWDGGDLRVMRARDPLIATDVHCSVIGHITVEELRRRLNDTEAANGFANRFLFIAVRRSQLLSAGDEIPEEEFGRLGRFLRSAIGQARTHSRVRRSQEAEELWGVLYARMAEEDRGGLLGAITARAEAQVLRLSLTYALIDGASTIEVHHLEAAWAFWSYCEASAAYIFGDALGDEVADRLLSGLRRAHPEGLDFTQQRDLFARHAGAKQLDRARGVLERRGLVTTITVDTGGRPRHVSYFVPDNGATKATEDILGSEKRSN